MLARMNNCTSTLPSAKKRAAKGSTLLRRRSTLAHLGILFIYGTESLRQFTGRISHDFTMLQNDIHYFVMLHDETDFLVMLQDEAHCCVILHNDETYFCNVTD